LLNDYGVSNKLSIVRRKALAFGYLEKSLVVDYRVHQASRPRVAKKSRIISMWK